MHDWLLIEFVKLGVLINTFVWHSRIDILLSDKPFCFTIEIPEIYDEDIPSTAKRCCDASNNTL